MIINKYFRSIFIGLVDRCTLSGILGPLKLTGSRPQPS